ncbi:MAG: hypothetical protein GC191_04280 [Azospirillum sp.]|nr:hypothetical protein [Azospirillum sp.]
MLARRPAPRELPRPDRGAAVTGKFSKHPTARPRTRWHLTLCAAIATLGLCRGGVALAATAPPVHDCDRLAASNYDSAAPVAGIKYQDLDAERAIPACRHAVTAWPATARFEYQLGRALERRGEVEEAVTWYARAAEHGHVIAQYNLGAMYEVGDTVPQDDAAAFHWLRRSASQGLALAEARLGNLYRLGLGIAADPATARRWLERAVAQDEPLAMFYLGQFHEQGSDGTPDQARAIAWYRKAAARGQPQAVARLKALGQPQ